MSADSFEEEAKYAEIYMEFSDLIFQNGFIQKNMSCKCFVNLKEKRQCLNWQKSMITASGTYGN